MTNLLFEHPLGDLGVTQHFIYSSLENAWPTSYWTFFVSSYGWDVISKYLSKSAFFRGGGSLWAQILGARVPRPQPLLISENYSVLLPHHEDRMILFLLVWIGYQRVTDGQTDGRTDRRNCCRYYSALHCKQCGRAVMKIKTKKFGPMSTF